MTDKKLWFHIAVILCVAGIITFFYLGNLPLFDPDEPVYAETPREMLQFQDFSSPRIYGEFWYDKPPMYYWLVAGAFTVFGVGEFAARFPSALLAVAGAVLVYLSGRKLFNNRTGLLAALVLASSLEYFYLGKAAVTDMTLTFFLTAALLAFLHRRYYLLYGCAALAVLTKGPIGIVFCGAIIGIYLVLTGSLRTVKRMKIFSGAALFAVIALPWYLVMYYYHGMSFVETFLGFHNVTRFLQPEHPSGNLWYYYIPVLILGFFPWTAFLGQAFIGGLKAKGEDRKYCIFLAIWAAVVFLFFTLSQTKLVSYILPMYPPLALLTGWYFDKAWTEKRYSALQWSAKFLTMLILVLVAGLFYAGTVLTAQLLLPVKIMAGIFLMLVILVWWLSYRRNFRAVFSAIVMGMMVFSMILVARMLPAVAPAFSVKTFVNEFKQHYDRQAPVYITKFYRPGFMFYSGMSGREIQPEELQNTILETKTAAYFFIQKKHYEKLTPSAKDKVQVLTVQEDKILFIRVDE